MSLSVSSFFIEKSQATVVNSIIKRFTFNGSDISPQVMTYGTIVHDVAEIAGGSMVIELENASQVYNSFFTDKTQFFKDGTFEFGFATAAGSEDLTQFFGGELIDIDMDDAQRVTMRFSDKLARLGDRKIGTEESPVSFTGSDYNPADLAWFVQASYGGLSEVKSTSNPDVDYPTWLGWWQGFDDDSVVVRAEFTGETVLEALEKIAKLTDSVIYDEGDNRLDYERWTGVTSFRHTISESYVLGVPDVTIVAEELINRVEILFDHNPTSGTWAGSITKQNTASVNSYGLREEIYDDSVVWYVNSLAAINQAERTVFRRKEPNVKAKVKTPLRFLEAVVGDMVEISLAVHSWDVKLMTLTGYEIDFMEKTMVLDIDEGFGRTSGKVTGFLLDDAYWGLLDQSYNPLF